MNVDADKLEKALTLAKEIDDKTQKIVNGLAEGFARIGYTPQMISIMFDAISRKCLKLSIEMKQAK